MPRMLMPLLISSALLPAAYAQLPAFCAESTAKAEQLICGDADLLRAEARLAQAYAAARVKAGVRDRKRLALEQKGWRAGVNDCWKAQDLRACVADGYALRTAELQTAWALVPARPPVVFTCADGVDVTVTYFETEPGSLVARRGAATSLMRSAPAASGTHYIGRNESIREHQGVADVTWGYGAPPVACRPRGEGK